MGQGGFTVGTKRSGDSELASLTVSMLLSLAYFVAVCWIFPVIPMAIVSIFELPVTAFFALWLGGSLFTGLTLYLNFRKRK